MTIEDYNVLLYRFMGGKVKDGIVTTNAQDYPSDNKGYSASGFIKYHESWSALMPVFLYINKKYNAGYVITSHSVSINHTGLRVHTEPLILIAFSTIIKYLREEHDINPGFNFKHEETSVQRT